ncbi:MAG TPA: DnaJ domain-containing protein [Nostocaceae cyanobacterium]|nr:DnaJ domain-containing protein [Nostocaceae cyanobacterium]
MAYELYHVLELSPQASPEEIKRSYYRLVRKYSPEKDPERFKSIREAYETLSDPKGRDNYDALQKHGEQVSKLFDEAEAKMSDGEWSKAILLLKQIILLFPGGEAARNRLGICYIRAKEWDNAIKVYRKLTKDNPETPLYWFNYGYAYKEYAESLEDDDLNKSLLYNQAREQFKQAIDLEPYNSEPYLEISRTYTDEEDYSKALSWAERAIGADGKTDLQDFETLFYICIIHLRSREYAKIQTSAQRIISLIPDGDEDISKYVASRFADIGFEVGKAGYDSTNIELLRAGASFLNAAIKFDPNNQQLKEAQELIEGIYQAYDLVENLQEDSQISTGFYRLAIFNLASALSHEIEDRKQVFDNILTEIFSVSFHNVLSSVRRIKYYYYPIYKMDIQLYDQIESVAKEQVQAQSNQAAKKPNGVLEGLLNFFGLG